MQLALLFLAAGMSPLQKTIELLTSLQGKVLKDGEEQKKLYEEFLDFCEDRSKELQYSVKTGKSEMERQAATVADAGAKSAASAAKADDLAATIATSQADLKAAQEIRAQEASDYATADADLAETVDMLTRAVGIMNREVGKSFVQSGAIQKVADALKTLSDASKVSTLDKMKLQALLQADDEAPDGAPDAAAYESHSNSIIAVLEDMAEKAKAQRSDGQKAEMTAKHNFEMLQQQLQDSISNTEKDFKATQKAKAEFDESKSMAEGELSAATTSVQADSKELDELQHDCMGKASEYSADEAERANEVAALQKAKQILTDTTAGAGGRAYSFVQVTSSSHGAKARVDAFLQSLAAKDGSPLLAQLALRVKSVSEDSADPFGKVRGLIQDMIEKLVADAEQEASHKAFCDKEMSETKEKKEDKEAEIEKLTTRIDKATAKIAKLKEEVASLQSELAAIARQQQQATALRDEQKAAWAEAKADYEAGVEGVESALGVLRDYYASSEEALLQTAKHAKSTGASTGIIGLLEVVMSDFSKLLAEGTMAENNAQASYDKMTQENQVATMTKKTEVEYKTKDEKQTKSHLSAVTSDQSAVQAEYDAVLDYWAKLQPMCVAKAEPYAERKRRREAEIGGLKEAMSILEGLGSTAFLQIRRA